MALTARSRSVLYQGLTDLIEDEVAVGELLSYFPARDDEEPATKEFVAAQFATTREHMASELGATRLKVTEELAATKEHVAAEFAATRELVAAQAVALRVGLAEVRAEMAAMETRLTAQANAQTRMMIQWTLGAMVSLMGLVIAMGFVQGP